MHRMWKDGSGRHYLDPPWEKLGAGTSLPAVRAVIFDRKKQKEDGWVKDLLKPQSRMP